MITIKALSYNELLSIVHEEKSKEFDINFEDISEIQKKAIKIKLHKMQRVEKELHEWFTYWIIKPIGTREVAGLIGFKGIESDGSVEVGYGIFKKFEGKGYATEALRYMINWAFSHKSCKEITALGVKKENIGSQRVLYKNGFEKINENEGIINYRILNNKLK